jgi:RNA polymerase sigma-70 factor (ECF subfamily)
LIIGDGALLTRSAAGDREAFDRFVERNQDAVYRYLAAILGQAADAEDAMQETFLAAWRNAASFRGEGEPRAWLFAIARHAAGRLRRRRVDEPAKLESLDELGLEAGWGGHPEPLPDSGAECTRVVAAALDRLRPEEREIIVLRDLEGFSGDESAALLGLSLPAMKTRLHRARLRFAAEVRRDHD